MTTTRKSKKFIHEGKYAAEVMIELAYTDDSWSPTMSLEDARKLETVRLALSMIPKKPAPDLIRGGYRFSDKIMLHQKCRGDIAEAGKHGRVFELTPVAMK